mgnify:CR=1 FL=1
MARAPIADLATHTVANQPPPFADVNLYTSDIALRHAVAREGAAWMDERLIRFGARTGSAEVADWARRANQATPALQTFDRFGHRIDEVDYHPAYHRLMDLGIGHGVSALAWTATSGGHVAHAALLYLMAQAEAGVC